MLSRAGYEVTGADIVNRGYSGQTITADFLERRELWEGDIITNPPYKYAAEFVAHSLELVDDGARVAMFLKLTFLEGEKRRKLFAENPPHKIYVFTRRVNCALNGNVQEFDNSSAVCYAWFIWTKGYKGQPSIYWI